MSSEGNTGNSDEGRLEIGRAKMPDGIHISYKLTVFEKPLLPGILIFVHGRLDSKDTGLFSRIMEGVKGYDTLMIDARGMGESEGVTTYRGASQEAKDLKVLIDQLTAQGKTFYAIIGHSRGCSVIGLLATALCREDQRLLCPNIVFVGGRFDTTGAPINRFTPTQMEELKTKGSFTWLQYPGGPWPSRPEIRDYKITQEDIDVQPGSNELHSLADLPEGTRVLLLHGTSDGSVPIENAHKSYNAISKGSALCDLWIMDGIGHFWDREGEETMLRDMLFLWLRKVDTIPRDRREIHDTGKDRAGNLLLGR